MKAIGYRLRVLRERKRLSREDIEKRTGLRCRSITNVENGDAAPTLETLLKLAQALKVPLYQLFYNGKQPPRPPRLRSREAKQNLSERNAGEALILRQFLGLINCLNEKERDLLLGVAERMTAIRAKPRCDV